MRKKKQNNMKKLISVIIIVGAIVVLAVTCPDKSAHQDAIRDVVTKASEKQISKLTGDNKVASLIGGVLGGVFVNKVTDTLLDSQLEVNNYVLFSVGKINLGDEEKNISFGILNNVYTINEEDVFRAMEK